MNEIWSATTAHSVAMKNSEREIEDAIEQVKTSIAWRAMRGEYECNLTFRKESLAEVISRILIDAGYKVVCVKDASKVTIDGVKYTLEVRW